MVVIGADLHKRSHTLVAVDESGRKLAEKTARATPAGTRLRKCAAWTPGCWWNPAARCGARSATDR